MGKLFPLEGSVATSVAILIGRETIFPHHSSRISRRSHWPSWDPCTSLSRLVRSRLLVGPPQISVQMFNSKSTSRGWNPIQEYLPVLQLGHYYACWRGGPFCISYWGTTDAKWSGHVLTSEQRWGGVIFIWTGWPGGGERTAGVPLPEDRTRDAGQAKLQLQNHDRTRQSVPGSNTVYYFQPEIWLGWFRVGKETLETN